MRPNWKPGTKIVCVMKFQSHDSISTPNIAGVNVPRVGEVVTIHSTCDIYSDSFNITEYLFDSIIGCFSSFQHHKFRKLVEIDSEVSEALSELTVQERLDTVSEPVIINPTAS